MQKKGLIYGVILFIILVGVCITGIGGLYLIRKPLGPAITIEVSPLVIASETNSSFIAVPTATHAQTQQPADSPQPEPVDTLTPTDTLQPIPECGPWLPTTIQIALSDSTAQSGLIGMWLIIVSDPPAQIKIVPIPVQVILPADALSSLNLPDMQLNKVYEYIQTNAAGDPASVTATALQYIIQANEKEFGYKTDFYYFLSQDGAGTYIAENGGINVDLPFSASDNSQENQTIITNLDSRKLSDLACIFQNTSSENWQLLPIPSEYFTSAENGGVKGDPTKIIQYLQDLGF